MKDYTDDGGQGEEGSDSEHEEQNRGGGVVASGETEGEDGESAGEAAR